MNNTHVIVDAIETMRHRFSKDLTALWVTATGKPELFVRDHLGAIIAERNPSSIVSREWNKHDLAILDRDANPQVLIEGKHLYDFDLHSTSIRGRYQKSILNDLEKMREAHCSQSYISLLMTSIRTPIPKSLARVTKYSPGINRALIEYGPNLMETSVLASQEFLAEFGKIVVETDLVNGQVFGLDIHLWMWLVDTN